MCISDSWKDASPGYESAAPVILQGHMDMVCAQTEDCPKDMTREGLDLATDGHYVWAEKTSLGGDDCIAVAAIFAILADDSLPHPPLEAVITVDEERGMDGAVALDCSDLKGRRDVYKRQGALGLLGGGDGAHLQSVGVLLQQLVGHFLSLIHIWQAPQRRCRCCRSPDR